ncbi:MAG: DUF2530 domain-containing protein [Actinomycetota bacterium]
MTPSSSPAPPRTVEPLGVDVPRVVLAGIVGWAIALAVTLLVPALHTGRRDWWPWACVAGVVIGALGLAYVRRGRGNAAAARRSRP